MYQDKEPNGNKYRFRPPTAQNPQWIRPKLNFQRFRPPRPNFQQNASCATNYNPAPFQQPNFHRKPLRYDSQHQRGWGKRSHTATPLTVEDPTTSSETSPSPKRQLQQQKSSDSNQSNKSTKKKNTENSPANVIQTQKDKDWQVLFEYTLKLLEKCMPNEEVNTLLFYLQNSRADCVQMKDAIRCALFKLLLPLGVKEILVFGSTLTSLDFKGSDLDFHVQLIKPPSSEEEVKQIIQTAGKLTRFNYDFKVIYSIQNARVPIIRLVHQSTRTTCDINFTSRFGYYNSCFIGQVLSYDKRVKDLAVIIKLWAKAHKIAERMIMSNYCLLMLVIFYLQNLEQPMLYSIKQNQEGKRSIFLDSKYKWNVFFNDSINRTHENNLTVRQLLAGFFDFYQKLDFSSYIVSLYNGNLIPRNEFDDHPDFTAYRDLVQTGGLPPLRFENTQMFIVQDGFEQNLNIGIKYKKNLDFFCALVKASNELVEELKDEPMSVLLVKLFTGLKIPEPENEKKILKAKKKFHMKINAIAGDLKFCQDILSAEDRTKVYSEEDQHKFFYNHVLTGMKEFLEEVYLCTVTPKPETEEPMKQDMTVFLNFDTINGRKKMNFKSESTMDAEISLSKKMYEKHIPIELDVNLSISSKNNGKTVEIDMMDNKSADKKSALPSFGTFFAVNVIPALKFYLKKRLDEAMK